MAKAILNISNYSGGLNNKTNSRDIEDNQFQDLDSLSIETPGKLKVMGAVNDYAGSITADTATGVKYGNGLFHFNADYDIDDTTALIENNEILFVNTDSGSSNAPIVKPFELTKTVNNVVSNKLTYSSRTDITYGDTWSEVDYNAVDGVVRITPTSFVETNKPIKLQHINENYYLGADSSNVLFGDTGKTLTSAVVEGTTSATTTSTNESSDFNVGDKIKFQITFGTFTFTSLPVELTGVTSTEIQFAAFGGMSVYAIGAKVLKASNSVNLLQSEIGWKKLDTELPEITENEVKIWNLNTPTTYFLKAAVTNVDASSQGNNSFSNTSTTIIVNDGSKFQSGNVIKIGNEYIKITTVNLTYLTVVRGYWGTTATTISDDASISILHYAAWGEVFNIPTAQSGSNPFYIENGVGTGTARGPINIAFWVGKRESTSNVLPADDTGTFFTSTDSLVNIYSEIVYLDNQRSPLKYETRLESSKVNQSVHATIWGRVPNKTNIKSVKIYYSEVKSNYNLNDTSQTSPGEDYNKQKIKYLLFEIDFRKGIRYAGGEEYYNAEPVIHSTAAKSVFTYPKTGQTWLGSNAAINDNYIQLGSIELKDKPENVSAEPYIEVDPYILGQYGTGYKTSTVANRRLYIGNVMYTDPITKELKPANDTIFKSNVNAFDTFTFDSRIDVEINDGDDIIALESLGSKLLEFKRNHLYVINIARDVEFLEATLEYKGCERPYHVLRGEGFIAWFNKFGFYLYDGKQVRDLLLDKVGQERLVWDNYYSVNNVIGFDPEQKNIVIINKNQKILAFDLKSMALYFRSKGATTNDITNIVTTNAGDLVFLEKYNGTNVDLRKYNIAPSKLDASQINEMALKTKEYTFGKPSVDKKIISVYLSYKNGDGVELYGFRNDGEEELLATLDGNSETNFKTLHIPIRKAKTEFVDKKRFDRIKGFGLRFSGSDVATDFEVNDIQVVFREKSVK